MSNYLPMKIRLETQEMSSAAIADAIPADVLAEIKRTDARPLFRAYTLAHEGQSRGRLVGVGNIIKTWAASVIRKLHDRLTIGLEMFLGHGKDNSIDPGRIVVGKVVAKKLVEIDGRTSSVVIAHIDPLYSAMALDVCSLEGSIDLAIDKAGNMTALDVDKISGIALGNSSMDTPGFEFATIQGALQAFAVEHGITGPAEPIGEGEPLSPYLDPKVNKFIRFSDDDARNPATLDVDERARPEIDPRTNPMIKVD
jgi:hypothetical protein